MDKNKIIESLSPHERKILPFLEEKSITDICKKSNLDKTSVMRSLSYLENKKIIKILHSISKILEIGLNGALYLKKGLPERRLLVLLGEKRILPLPDAKKLSGLSEDEFKASIGTLKKKAMIELKNGKIILTAPKEEVSKKTIEELLLESLPIEFEKLTPPQKLAYENLKSRKEIIQLDEKKETEVELTPFGKTITKIKIKEENLIEQITTDILKKDSMWQRKKFRRYDVSSPVPSISGGKRHFVNQAIDYGKKAWLEMGFEEMTGKIIQSSFWNFDALFTAQDHPVREMQDTFFVDKKEELHEDEIIKKVKKAHEEGTSGSTGWKYNWDVEEAKKMVLRTHTTCLSAQTLAKIDLKDLPKKYFSLGKCFRNETIDWNHGFEFNQSEGIVIDENANFTHLLGYLKKFAQKMGYEKVRFRPAYFPYTEPSVEGDVWDEEKKEWVELIAAGIFRPEVTEPLLGKPIPVLAWGPGFDRMLMKMFGIKDLRELYKNDLNLLRKIKILVK